MTKRGMGELIIAVILGITASIFWSMGEQRLAVFMVATIIFQIFFIVGEEKPEITESKFSQMFQEEMKKFKNSKIFK